MLSRRATLSFWKEIMLVLVFDFWIGFESRSRRWFGLGSGCDLQLGFHLGRDRLPSPETHSLKAPVTSWRQDTTNPFVNSNSNWESQLSSMVNAGLVLGLELLSWAFPPWPARVAAGASADDGAWMVEEEEEQDSLNCAQSSRSSPSSQ